MKLVCMSPNASCLVDSLCKRKHKHPEEKPKVDRSEIHGDGCEAVRARVQQN